MISFSKFIKLVELNEGRKEYLVKYSNEIDVKDIVNKFLTIRQRLKSPENDIDYWIKKPYSEFKEFVLGYDLSKNKSDRKQDQYVKKAEAAGAIYFGNFGLYEAWFIPTYEAAVELGRFYKNLSTKWCICTDNPDFFNQKYAKFKFVFLISDDRSLGDKQKLALQIDDKFLLEGIWDIKDNDIRLQLSDEEDILINDVVFKFKNEIYLNYVNNMVKDFLRTDYSINGQYIPDKYINYITHIDIPKGAESIVAYAFEEYKHLESITIPNSVTEIGDEAFFNCISLKSIVIPNSVTVFGMYVFNECESLVSAVLPNNISELYGTFKNCAALKSVVIPASVTGIYDDTFSGCKSLESIVIPDTVIEMGKNIFSYCNSLKVKFSKNSPLLQDIENGEYENWGLTKDQIEII